MSRGARRRYWAKYATCRWNCLQNLAMTQSNTAESGKAEDGHGCFSKRNHEPLLNAMERKIILRKTFLMPTSSREAVWFDEVQEHGNIGRPVRIPICPLGSRSSP
jgi:hypothetical protein